MKQGRPDPLKIKNRKILRAYIESLPKEIQETPEDMVRYTYLPRRIGKI
jgi:hypothetical protein